MSTFCLGFRPCVWKFTQTRMPKLFVKPRLMPVRYSAEALAEAQVANEIPFGAAPHHVTKELMFFDPLIGGWASVDAHKSTHRAKSPAKPNPNYIPPPNGVPRLRDKHIERPHYGTFGLDMKKEIELGLAPVDWSVSSAMNDPRPLGRPVFDARFVEAPMGRARGGRNMAWTPVGTADAGLTTKAENIDIVAAMRDIADTFQDAAEDAGLNMGSAHAAGGRFFKEAEHVRDAQLVLAAGSRKSDKY